MALAVQIKRRTATLHLGWRMSKWDIMLVKQLQGKTKLRGGDGKYWRIIVADYALDQLHK